MKWKNKMTATLCSLSLLGTNAFICPAEETSDLTQAASSAAAQPGNFIEAFTSAAAETDSTAVENTSAFAEPDSTSQQNASAPAKTDEISAADDSGNTVESAFSEASIVEASNSLAAQLTAQLAASGENTFLSPYSIYTALSVLALSGSFENRGDDAAMDELLTLLGIEEGLAEEEYAGLSAALVQKLTSGAGENADEEDFPTSFFETANSFLVREDYPPAEGFNELVALLENYQALVKSCDISSVEIMDFINDWVEENTHGMIESFLSQPLDPSTVAAILNTVYFFGTWDKQFDEYFTKKQRFTGAEGIVETDMMRQTEHFFYAENEDYQMLQLPYVNGFEMDIWLPKADGAALEEVIASWSDANVLESLFSADEAFLNKKISLSLPTFDLDCSASLVDTLSALGVTGIFEGVTLDRLSDSELIVSEILHQAKLSVDEEGTEAAAVTMILILETAMIEEPEEIIDFTCDHPFLFTIRDSRTGLILFSGCLMQPAGEILPPQQKSGVTASAGDVSPTGCTLTIENTTDKTVYFGEPYTLQMLADGQWVDCDIPESNQPVAWIELAYILPAGESSVATYDWSRIYGELSAGTYRFAKNIQIESGYPIEDKETIFAEFSVQPD